MSDAVTRLRRILVVVGEIEEAERFFCEAFAFQLVEQIEDKSLSTLLGVPDARARQSVMRLGEQEIGLLAFDPPGHAYPAASTATDLWFQHFAMVVSDMGAAYRRLQANGRFAPISEGGPQVLPPRSGSVSAFKFRDVDGHPLELLAFPTGGMPPHWQAKASGALFLGIDHSAIAVADTARSIRFYRDCLGLRLAEQTENHGAEQERLDALPGAAVTVSALRPVPQPTPHVELLGYHVGLRRRVADSAGSRDLAATHLVLETDALPAIVEALTLAEVRFVSPGVVTLANGKQAVAVLDPDDHRIIVTD